MTERGDEDHRRRRAILRQAEEVIGNVAKTCRYYGISRQLFYVWKRRFDDEGLEGLRDAPQGGTKAWRPRGVLLFPGTRYMPNSGGGKRAGGALLEPPLAWDRPFCATNRRQSPQPPVPALGSDYRAQVRAGVVR